MNGNEIFNELKLCVAQFKESLGKIVEKAPNEKLYNVLLESKESLSFLNMASDGDNDGVSIDDEDIKFAVGLKKALANGRLEYLQRLMEGGEIVEYSNPGGDEGHFEGSAEPVFDAEEPKAEESIVNGLIEATNIASGGAKGTSETEKIQSDDTHFISPCTDIALSFNSAPSNTVFTSYNNSTTIHKRNRDFTGCTPENPPEPPQIEDEKVYEKIFTHQSVLNYLNISNEAKTQMHNERLEFIGDSILGFVVSMIIYEKFPFFDEGQLSMLRNKLVNNVTLLKYSQIYGFDKQLRKNYNDLTIITGNSKVYADVFEAYLGGIVETLMLESMDGETNTSDFLKGWFEIKDWIEELFQQEILDFDPNVVFKSNFSKSSKQELRLLVGQSNCNLVDYIRCKLSNQRFLSCVKISKKIYGYGIGTSNKEADSRAATDAMCNPALKKICPEENWKKFEDFVGSNELGGLDFKQHPKKIEDEDMNVLKAELSIKYKSGDIKLLKSQNNGDSFLIDDSVREQIRQKLESVHQIDDSDGEMLEPNTNTDTSNNTETNNVINNNTGQTHGIKNDVQKDEAPAITDEYNPKKYYGKEYTLGRGGIFSGKETKRVKKKSEKNLKGIHRNKTIEILLDENGTTKKELLVHEVLVDCTDEEGSGVDMESKNRINSIYARRGSQPSYVVYKTSAAEFLTELWFGKSQIVCYGLDKNKRVSSQKAAMLAMKREDYYG